MVLKELKAKGAGKGKGGHWHEVPRGLVHLKELEAVEYTAPQAVYVNEERWLHQEKQVANATLGCLADHWLEE